MRSHERCRIRSRLQRSTWHQSSGLPTSTFLKKLYPVLWIFWIMIIYLVILCILIYKFLSFFRSFSHSPARLWATLWHLRQKCLEKLSVQNTSKIIWARPPKILGMFKRKLLSLFEDVYMWHGVRRFYVGLPWFILIVIVRGLNWNGLGLAMKYLSANQIKLNMCTSFFPRWVPSTQITF